jgi:hypothetical protein
MTTNPPQLATTLAISSIWRVAYIRSALEYRKAGRRKEKRLALHAAFLEKMNSRELLGPAPF